MTYEQRYRKLYYQTHKEEIREYNRAYNATHKERKRDLNRLWHQKNRRHKDKTSRTYCKAILYTVWNNKTDELVILDGTADECCKAMGISKYSFNSLVTRARQGKNKKWIIETRKIEEEERE